MTKSETPWYAGTQLPAETPTAGWFTCLHHEGPPIEWSHDVRERIAYIHSDKPAGEIPTRLHHIAHVHEGRVPPAYDEAWKAHVEAWKAYVEARKAYDEAWKAYDEAWKAYDEAWKACVDDLNGLVRELVPDCQWNGTTIFSKETP